MFRSKGIDAFGPVSKCDRTDGAEVGSVNVPAERLVFSRFGVPPPGKEGLYGSGRSSLDSRRPHHTLKLIEGLTPAQVDFSPSPGQSSIVVCPRISSTDLDDLWLFSNFDTAGEVLEALVRSLSVAKNPPIDVEIHHASPDGH